MKNKNKLIPVAMLLGISMSSMSIAQTVTGGGTTNKILRWQNGGTSTVQDAQIYDDGTNVGIGLLC